MNGHRLRYVGPAIVVVVIALLLSGSSLLSHFLSNIALVELNRSLAKPDVSHDLAQVETWLRQAVALDDGNLSAWRGLGYAALLRGDETAARSAWHKAMWDTQDFVSRGNQARANMQYRAAIDWYERALDVEPAQGVVRYFLGQSFEQFGEWEQARDAYETALLYSDIGDIVSSVKLHLGIMLQTRIEPNDAATALVLYTDAIARDSFLVDQERIEAHYYRGSALQNQSRLAEAREEFEWVLRQRPDHYWANVGLGAAMWQEQRDVDQAEKYLKHALAVEPRIKWAYRQLGVMYQATGRDEEASEMYERVLNIDAQDAYVAEQLKKLNQTEGD